MKIDLGEKSSEAPMAISEAEEPKEVQTWYPSIYLHDKEEMPDIPEEGYARVKYKVTSKTISERDDKKRCSMEIEIQEIEPEKERSGDDEYDVEEEIKKSEKELQDKD